jgi:choice-of-anchor B domain-containing protein
MRASSYIITPATAVLFFLPFASACSPHLAGGGDAVAGVGQPRQDAASSQATQAATAADIPNTQQAVTGREVKCTNGKAQGFDCQQVDLLSFLPVRAIGGDGVVTGLWGWVDSTTRREFALVGRTDGTAFVEVTDPVNPKYLGKLPVPRSAYPSLWRDIKVYRNHAFIVSDVSGSHGMLVFDLTQLRAVKNAPAVFRPTARYDQLRRAHTIALNEATGFAYVAGGEDAAACGGGVHIFDVREPARPALAGCIAARSPGPGGGRGYVHEAHCVVYRGPDQQYQGREICVNTAITTLDIVDVTDKKQPVAITSAMMRSAKFLSQGWFTEDQRYFFASDELDEEQFEALLGEGQAKTVTVVVDLTDLDKPVASAFRGTTSATDHNLYIRGRYMYQSNYAAGLRVFDIGDPKTPKETGYFDTFPDGGADRRGTMRGAWTNYPYFSNGVVAVTSMAEGLFLLRPPR